MSEHKKILYRSYRKYWHLIALALLFSVLAAAFEGLGLGLLIPFLKNLSGSGGDGFHTGWQWIDQWMFAEEVPLLTRLYRICGLIVVATFLRAIFGYFASTGGQRARARVVEDMRMRVVNQILDVSVRFFTKKRSGEFLNILTNELQSVGAALSLVMIELTRGSLLLVYVAFMFLISWQLSLLVVLFFGLLAFGLTRIITLVRQSGKEIPKAGAAFISSATELINGIRTVTAYDMKAFERERMQKASNRYAEAIIRTGERSHLVQPISQAVVGTVLIIVVLLATQFYVLPGKLDMALLLTFLFALMRLVPIVHDLNRQRGQWATIDAAMTEVASFLRRHDKPYLENGKRELASFKDDLVFKNVSFSYEPESPVLQDINLHIRRGTTTAIIGSSGAGKSTLVDLIPRLYDPTEGIILLDGIDLRAYRLSSIRQKIAVVSQDTFLFNDSVRVNIAYGCPDATFDRIRDAAERANALTFIEEMPEGFDTILGDRGVRLSGGQRQRLAIARALLRDPEILILDEATSALDSVSERLVQQSLDNLRRGRTAIVIAHRLSTVESADQIVVLEEGKIVEQGTYEELLEKKGQLWEYHAIQFQMS